MAFFYRFRLSQQIYKCNYKERCVETFIHFCDEWMNTMIHIIKEKEMEMLLLLWTIYRNAMYTTQRTVFRLDWLLLLRCDRIFVLKTRLNWVSCWMCKYEIWSAVFVYICCECRRRFIFLSLCRCLNEWLNEEKRH